MPMYPRQVSRFVVGSPDPPSTAPNGLLASWLPPGVVAAEVSFAGPLDALYPSEEQAVARAGEKRRAEFRAGRHCARRVLERLAVVATPVPQGRGRMPLWPDGIVGSISHSGDLELGYAVAIGARSSEVRALGVDIEREPALAENLWERILTPEELRFLERLARPEHAPTALVVFGIKECVYKCQYPLLGQALEFAEVSVSLDLEQGRFQLRSQNPQVEALLGPASGAVGQFRRVAGWLACALVLPATA